jgi:hypothetical protein
MPNPDKIDLNLDTVEEESIADFTFSIGAESFTVTNARDLDWKILMDMESPLDFFRHCMKEEDKERFLKQDISGRKMNILIETYMKHFGLGDKGNGVASRI